MTDNEKPLPDLWWSPTHGVLVREEGTILSVEGGDFRVAFSTMPEDAVRLVIASPEPPVDDVEHHIVEFREQGWTIKHPLSCRPNLFECPVNRAAEGQFAEPPEQLGRFVCGLAEDGQLVIGTEIQS